MTNETSKQSNSLTVRRIIRAPAERVYRAFLDPDAMAKWSPPHGFVGRVTESNPVEGGGYKMYFKNLTTQESLSFGGTYVELVPNKLIRYNDAFDDPSLPGTMQVTISFEEKNGWTTVTILQEGIPSQIPVEFAHAGWQESLQLLELLVVPEISAKSPGA